MLDTASWFRGSLLRRAAACRPLRWLPAAAAVCLAVAFSGLAVPRAAWADQGLDTFCWKPNYGCTSGGYAGQPPSQWPNKQWASGWGYWNGASVGNGGHHNCTLYAAYREALNGAPDPGNLGNAADWAGNAAAEGIPVNGTPAVGAIANWTQPNQLLGVGSAGHVAYVEAVYSDHIVTSEDNFGNNDTGGRAIYVGSPAWPNAFIHFGGTPTGPSPQTDLFVYNRGSGASYAELANGAGGWNGVPGPRFAGGWDFYPGNLDGNGWTDMFLYNPSTGASWAEFGNGAGGWTRGVKGPQFSTGWTVYTGNFNHDSLTDLFLYNKSTGASYVELANGHGGWTGVPGPRFSAGWDFYPGALNSDAYTDFFLYNPSTGASWVEFSDGAGHWTGGAPGPQFAPGWNIYPATLNSDGWTDLFLYNPSTGASWVEFANGAGSWINGVKGPQFSTGWTVYTGQLG
jgi:surface antigen